MPLRRRAAALHQCPCCSPALHAPPLTPLPALASGAASARRKRPAPRPAQPRPAPLTAARPQPRGVGHKAVLPLVLQGAGVLFGVGPAELGVAGHEGQALEAGEGVPPAVRRREPAAQLVQADVQAQQRGKADTPLVWQLPAQPVLAQVPAGGGSTKGGAPFDLGSLAPASPASGYPTGALVLQPAACLALRWWAPCATESTVLLAPPCME